MDATPQTEGPITGSRVGDQVEIAQIRRLYAAGDIDAAMALADRIRARERIPLTAVPVVTVTMDALMKLPLDHRAGFMLTRIDGVSNVQNIIDISAMPFEEAMQLLEKLLTVGALGLASEDDEPTAPGSESASTDDEPTVRRSIVPPS
jgi:hypothetical protein